MRFIEPPKLKTVWTAVVAIAASCGMGQAQTFTHPGLLHTQADLDRIRAKIAAGEQPWLSGWTKLIANSHAQLSYNPNPQPWICRGGACTSTGLSQNYMIMAHDAAADDADPDGDGQSNTNEALAGTSPIDANSLFAVRLPATADADFVMGFPTVPAKLYRVLWCADLTENLWRELTNNVPGTGAAIEIHDPNTWQVRQRFYRVELQP